MKTNYACSMLLFFFSCCLYAQEKAGITGVLKDPNGNLPGATIRTADGQVTTSGLDGSFSLTGLPEGEQLLTFSYIGYVPVTKTIAVSGAKVVDMGVIQFGETGGTTIEQVVVRGGMANTQAKALNIQKTSPAIMNVIASDAIGKLPDRNAAEAVQRVQGVSIERDHGEGRYASVRGTPMQWNSTLINGNRMPTSEGTSDNTSGTRSSPLDIFPSEMIEFVQVAKAITPDMEGDAIGGSINFITRTAPSSSVAKISVGGGYNGQAQKGTYSGSLLYGDRLFNHKFGFIVGASYWKRNWGTDNTETRYDFDDFSIQDFELRDYKGIRTTYGIHVGMEYMFSPSHKVFFRGVKTDFQDRETALEHTFQYQAEKFVQRRREGITGVGLFGGELGGNHRFAEDRFLVNWKLSSYETEMKNRGVRYNGGSGTTSYNMATFQTDASFTNIASNGRAYLALDAPAGYEATTFEKFLPIFASPVSAADMRLNQLIAIQTPSFEQDRVAELDGKYHVNAKLTVKLGAKYKNKSLRRGGPMDIYINTQQPTTLSSLGTEPYNFNGGYMQETGVDYSSVLFDGISLKQLDGLFAPDALAKGNYYHLSRNEQDPESAASFYSGTENVSAGFAMAEWKATDYLDIIGGMRYEHTDLTYDGYEVTERDETATIREITNSSSFDAFLPMLHLKYKPSENMNIRTAYTRTFARANFSDLNPTERINPLSTIPSISRGNIHLKPTSAHNVDLMGEYFFSDIGVASAGVFYKKLDNVIYAAQSFQQIDGVLHRLTQPENSENGQIVGFEVGLSKRLSFLPDFWRGFGIDANYTFTSSKMDVPLYTIDENGNAVKTITTEALPNQSKHLFNTALFYENEKFMARIAGNYKGAALALVQGNPENYRWYGANFTVDFSANYRINKKISTFIELNNLTNAPLRYYHGDNRRLEQLEYYSLRGMIGINYQLF
ncbi:TonB-dependent receptor [Sphingobacterium suaedae]|uniref:TonB-dependent receptor n=1 Tax=Sphingobacterium suaedae TaxID=1686402 RepID=A0ABW5KE78_9SPHI